MTDRANTAIAAGVLLILVLILALLRVTDLYLDQKRQADKYQAQLTKTGDKLHYYIWRESKSLGNRVGPEKFDGKYDPMTGQSR